MSELIVRRLLIDLAPPVDRHWCGGDAFLTAWFNALSMSFPLGEQFFIDAVRDGFKVLPSDKQAAFKAEVQGFVGQEATHRRLHTLFNTQIEKHGLVNAWETRAAARLKMMQGANVRHALAITAANEHFTALFAEWLLARPQILDGSEPRLKTLWLWHCAEEAEHKCTAFDLYQALGGNHAWRVKWMRRITLIFLTDTLRQTVDNLRRDGTLWRWSTWRSAARHMLGRDGLLPVSWKAWRSYFKTDFHPNQHGSERSAQWLREHEAQFTPVGSAA